MESNMEIHEGLKKMYSGKGTTAFRAVISQLFTASYGLTSNEKGEIPFLH